MAEAEPAAHEKRSPPGLRRVAAVTVGLAVSTSNVVRAALEWGGEAALAKLYAIRLAPSGNAGYEVRPGRIRTPMTDGAIEIDSGMHIHQY